MHRNNELQIVENTETSLNDTQWLILQYMNKWYVFDEGKIFGFGINTWIGTMTVAIKSA